MNKSPKASIIIPALNSGKTIAGCLESVRGLDYPKARYEVIVVDNGSRDNTAGIAKSFSVRVFRKPGLNVSQLRNFGAKKAKGEILAFLDSDCVVGKGWLKKAAANLSRKGTACTGYMYSFPGLTWVENAWSLNLMRGSRDKRLLPGGNIIATKKAFIDAGEFDKSLGSGEDQDICLRMMEKGYNIKADSSIKCIHLGEPSSLLHFFARQFSYGRYGMAFMRKHIFRIPASHAALFSIFSLASMACIIGSLAVFLMTGWAVPVAVFAAVFLVPVIAMSLFVSASAGKIRYFPALAVLYTAYGAARALALFAQKKHGKG